ncbi:MAG: hypothetical protein Kow00109_04810 [Acidobacteriota bacterium]
MLGDARGRGNLGCFITLVLTLLGIYLLVQVGPVYWDKINWEDEFQRIVNRAGAEGWSEEAIRTQVEKSLRSFGFTLEERGIEIERRDRFQAAGQLRVRVKFSRPVQFPGYVYVFRFEEEYSALRGRLL